jgi:16S rRNA (guanine966-N2)-methyltransferase
MIDKPVKVELRIVAGTLRGRRISVTVHPGLRPTPQMVREALFSILGNAVPGRAFYDVFAGTGICGLEAVSRGALEARCIENDPKSATAIAKYAEQWGVPRQVQVLRADVYRWAERWLPSKDPMTVFVSPPFPDLSEDRVQAFLAFVNVIWAKLPPDSVLALQLEDGFPVESLPDFGAWDVRKYGRNLLAFRVVDLPATPAIDREIVDREVIEPAPTHTPR